MKHVYIILTGMDGEQGIFDIFSTEEKANEKLEELKNDRYWRTTFPCIEKWEVK